MMREQHQETCAITIVRSGEHSALSAQALSGAAGISRAENGHSDDSATTKKK